MPSSNTKASTVPEHPRARSMLGVALALLTFAVFSRATSLGFVDYDDNQYITINKTVQNGLTLDGIAWAFTTRTASNWHPLTWISHMIDVSIFGVQRSWGHHLVNLLFHVASVVLLYALLLRMTGAMWRSALVAALFAVHPLHVESVAWVAERKDVLSTFFGMLAMHAYVSWSRSLRMATYIALVACFALSLLAKPMLVTLPCVLLLFDVWPLQRVRFKRQVISAESAAPHPRSIGALVIEKIPLFVLSIASSAITFWAQQKGGVVSSLENIGLAGRVANAVVAYATYLWKTFWPVNLAAMYPHPGKWPAATITLAAITLSACTIFACVFTWRRRSAPIIGWLFYLGTLVPVIGLVQVGSQSMADRYTYVPLIGVFLMLVWALPPSPSVAMRRMLAAASIAVIVSLSAITVFQIGYWRNSVTLFERALAMSKDNFIAHTNLSFTLVQAGDIHGASEHFSEALRINAAYAIYNDFVGQALMDAQNWTEALRHFDEVLSVQPDNPAALNNSATALLRLNRVEEALTRWRQSIATHPDHASSHANLGRALLQLQQVAEAERELRKAVELNPGFADAHAGLGLALALQGRMDEAINEFETALRLQPDHAEAQQYLRTAREQRQGGSSQ